MTKLNEMVETFEQAIGGLSATTPIGLTDIRRDGLLAVLEKHGGPMLAEAYAKGWNDSALYRAGTLKTGADLEYAARILAQLKEGK